MTKINLFLLLMFLGIFTILIQANTLKKEVTSRNEFEEEISTTTTTTTAKTPELETAENKSVLNTTEIDKLIDILDKNSTSTSSPISTTTIEPSFSSTTQTYNEFECKFFSQLPYFLPDFLDF